MRAARRRRVEVVELDERARRVLARRHPEVTGYGAAIVVAVSAEVKSKIVDAVRQLADAANDGRRLEIERLVDAMSPAVEVPPPEVVEEARRQATMRARMLKDFGGFSATELAEAGGSAAANRSQLAYRWRRDNKVFAVTYRKAAWYLGFQFDERGRPLPVVADVLRELEGWDEWAVAAWFVRPNGLLDRQRPVDLLSEDPDAVGDAAKHDGRAGPDRPS